MTSAPVSVPVSESSRREKNLEKYATGVLLTVSYLGTPFGGFARQENARTVAGELDGAVRAIDPSASLVRGLSRTDSGVHARDQRVTFDSTKNIPAYKWGMGLTRHLPKEISVVRAALVEPGFDARRHCVRKMYRYTLLESRVRDPFLDDTVWRIPQRLNHLQLAEVAQELIGTHDFAAFRGAADARTDTVREIFRIAVNRPHRDDRILEIDVEGDRFLYKMVRIIVGSVVDIVRGRLKPDAFKCAFESGNRAQLGITAPPQGLCLQEVVLDSDGWGAWPDSFDDRRRVA